MRQGLTEHSWRRSHGTAQQLWNLLQEVLVKSSSFFLEFVRIEVLELQIRFPEFQRSGPVFPLQSRDNGGDVLQVPLLQ